MQTAKQLLVQLSFWELHEPVQSHNSFECCLLFYREGGGYLRTSFILCANLKCNRTEILFVYKCDLLLVVVIWVVRRDFVARRTHCQMLFLCVTQMQPINQCTSYANDANRFLYKVIYWIRMDWWVCLCCCFVGLLNNLTLKINPFAGVLFIVRSIWGERKSKGI